MNSFMELAKARFSVRKYADTPIEEEKLSRILEAGRIAPTAKNSQAFKVYVCQSEEALAKIDEISPCRYGAPTVLLFVYDKENCFAYEDRNSGDQDCAIVATHIVLQAAEEGVRSVWVDRFSPSGAKKVFALPEQEQPVFLVPLGYAAEGEVPAPRHEQKRPAQELFFRI